MHTESRNGASIDRIYLHTNEGPQSEGAAFSLAHYLTTVDAGYHVIVDDKTTVVNAGDQQVVWAEGGDNHHALSLCMIGYSADIDWTTAYSRAMVERAAQQVALWCRAYKIPTVHVRPGAPGQAPTDRGIAEHADDHDPASQGHTDPGTAFPIGLFVVRVGEILNPGTDWAALARLVEWQKNVAANPLKAGESHPGVIILKQLLAKRGYHTEDGPYYGQNVTNGVAGFKGAHGLRNRIGEVCGGDCAHHLIVDPLP